MIMLKLAGGGPREEHYQPCCNDNFLPFFCLFPSPDHRRAIHHTHHPLSTHLPQRMRRRAHSTDRKRKKKRKKKKTSLPPSAVTPTIQEVDEEEGQSETDAAAVTQPPSQVKMRVGSKAVLPGRSEDHWYSDPVTTDLILLQLISLVSVTLLDPLCSVPFILKAFFFCFYHFSC